MNMDDIVTKVQAVLAQIMDFLAKVSGIVNTLAPVLGALVSASAAVPAAAPAK